MWCASSKKSGDLAPSDETTSNKLDDLFLKSSAASSGNRVLRFCKNRLLPQVTKLIVRLKRSLPLIERQAELEPRNKHVMFADSLGLDLELIHTIQINSQAGDELDKLITKQSFFNSYNKLTGVHDFRDGHLAASDVLVIPKFALSPDRNYEKLIRNGICLNSIEVYDQSSIRGVILTLTRGNQTNSSESSPINGPENSRETRRLIQNELQPPTKSGKRCSLDIVYIIWSVDDWASWKYQAAIKNNCRTLRPNKGILKTYEFFLQNLDLKLKVGQTLQLIVCHQIDLVVYKDTNNEECYKFECAIKV